MSEKRFLDLSHIPSKWRDMLSNACAFIAALALIYGARKSFPQEPSGVYAALEALYVVTTVYMGQRSGFFLLAISSLIVEHFLLEGEGFAIVNPNEALQFVVFIFSSICIILCINDLRARLTHSNKLLSTAKGDGDRQAMLLSELTHRVGNDLNVLVSICEMKAMKADHEETASALRRVSNRIHVFGSIYRQLNQSAGSSSLVEMDEFLSSICKDLRMAHLALRPITLETGFEMHRIQAGDAAVIGLILNEAITNAVKYAFPDDRSGTIHVVFGKDREDDGFLCLTVWDDGVGPSGETPKGTGIGQRVMRGMASQLGGTYQFIREDDRTVVTFRFPKPA